MSALFTKANKLMITVVDSISSLLHCCCENCDEAFVLATPCEGGCADGFADCCRPYFEQCYSDVITENGTVTHYFDFMNGCWQLTGNEVVLEEPDGHLLDTLPSATFDDCTACDTFGDISGEFPTCEWWKFIPCDCEDKEECEGLEIYVPYRDLFTRGGSSPSGNVYCGGTCMDDVDEIFWSYPGVDWPYCCMVADEIVDEVPDCCNIWTIANHPDLDDCCVSGGGGYPSWYQFWRGCCACCNGGNDPVDKCEIMAGILSSWSITYTVPSCPLGCTTPPCDGSPGGGGDMPRSYCATGAFSQTLNFTIEDAPHDDECTQQTGCMHHSMGPSETVDDCTGEPMSICQDGCVDDPLPNNSQWSMCWPQGSASGPCWTGDHPGCTHCGEAWCGTVNYWIGKNWFHFTYGIDVCDTQGRALSIDLWYSASIQIPYYFHYYCYLCDSASECTDEYCTSCVQNELLNCHGYSVSGRECFPIEQDAECI